MKTLGIGLVGARHGARMHLANYLKLSRDVVSVRNSGTCCVIDGLAEQPIQNVTLTGLCLSGTNGVICDYAKNITFNHMRITAQKNLFVANHVENVQKTSYTQVTSPPNQP